LLKQLVDSGRRIGLVAGLDERTLQTEVHQLGAAMPKTGPGLAAPYAPALEDALSALMDMDGARFREVLEQAALRLGRVEMLDGYLTPLMHRIGEACARGTLRIAHEHLATAEARGYLDGVTGAFPPTPGAPVLVIGTPVWQYHELGAMLAAATARAEGWQVVYLGPNLPPDELAAAARASGARAVGLSITVAGDPGTLDAELRTLRRMLPQDVALIVGGRAASSSGLTDSDGDVITCPSLPDLRGRLRALRSGAEPS
jgi:methanogenic corrinoid protein MtbC1